MQYVLSLNLHILCSIGVGGWGVGEVLALFEDLVILCSCTLFAHILLISLSTFMQIKLLKL